MDIDFSVMPMGVHQLCSPTVFTSLIILFVKVEVEVEVEGFSVTFIKKKN